MEGLQDGLQVVPAQVGHERRQRLVVVRLQKRGHAGHGADIGLELPAPGGAALEDERRIERVGAVVDPLAQRLAARPPEGRAQAFAVFDGHDPPAEVGEHLVDAPEQAVGHHGVQALPVVVDDPPDVAQVVLPSLEQGLVDVALVELGVADQRDHAPLGQVLGRPALEPHVVLGKAGEAGHGDAEADRTGREIDVVHVLGARRVGLRPAERTEAFQVVPALLSQQVLDRMEHRARVRLDRDPVVRLEHVEIERRHHGDQRGARGLMPADLQAVSVFAQVVGVVDHPAGQPEDLLFQLAKTRQPAIGRAGPPGFRLRCRGFAHGRLGHRSGRRPGRRAGIAATKAPPVLSTRFGATSSPGGRPFEGSRNGPAGDRPARHRGFEESRPRGTRWDRGPGSSRGSKAAPALEQCSGIQLDKSSKQL